MKFKKSSIGIAVIAVLIIAAISVVVMTGGNLNLGIKSPKSNVSDVATAETGKNEPATGVGNFESSKLGLSIAFPETWEGKYKVKEGDTGITVCFKPEAQIAEGKGIFFFILEKTKDVDEGHIDNVQYFEANGKTYITGGPTDVTYAKEDPEFDTFTKMQAEVPEVLKTLKSIKADKAAVKADEYKLADYFPFEKDIHLKYKGTNNEYAEYETYVDFITDDTIQIRNDNPGVMSAIVYTLKNGELKKVFNGGEGSYKHNYMSSRNQDEIILKEPIKVGTEWQLKDGEKRSITALEAEVQTPAGKYSAIEVKTEGKDFVITDYYAKGIGLIKNVYKAKEGDFTVLSELEKIERNVPYIHNMRVYFSDYANEKIFYQDRSEEVNTNQDIKFKFQKELKTPPEGSGIRPIISANTQIRSIVAEDKSDTVTVDFSEQLVNEMNAGSGAEMAIMKCLANTFGKYYERDKVIITINGKPYESGHEIMEPGEYLKVDDSNCNEYKK